jgi:hypothetical protein
MDAFLKKKVAINFNTSPKVTKLVAGNETK